MMESVEMQQLIHLFLLLPKIFNLFMFVDSYRTYTALIRRYLVRCILIPPDINQEENVDL